MLRLFVLQYLYYGICNISLADMSLVNILSLNVLLANISSNIILLLNTISQYDINYYIILVNILVLNILLVNILLIYILLVNISGVNSKFVFTIETPWHHMVGCSRSGSAHHPGVFSWIHFAQSQNACKPFKFYELATHGY